MMSARVCTVSPSTARMNGRRDKSTDFDGLHGEKTRAPKRSRLLLHADHQFVAIHPFGKPGKFSTVLVVVSKPPGMVPVTTKGERLERAA